MPEMTAHETECRKRCKWCAKGLKVYMIGKYNSVDPMHEVYPGPDALSEFFPCTAPTLAQFSEEQAAQIAELERQVNEWARVEQQIERKNA